MARKIVKKPVKAAGKTRKTPKVAAKRASPKNRGFQLGINGALAKKLETMALSHGKRSVETFAITALKAGMANLVRPASKNSDA